MYWGAVPFVLIQLLMVGVLIAFPRIVSTEPETAKNIENIHITIPADEGEPPLPLETPSQ